MRRFLLIVSFFLASFAHAQSVSDLVASYDAMRLGETRTASNVSITVGHATYTMPSGTASIVLAGDKPIGLFLSGAGTFRYETTNKDELSGIRYNTKNNDINVSISADKAVVEDSFTSVFLWGNGLPEITGAAAASATAAFAGHRELFERSKLFTSSPSHAFAYHALDNPQARMVRAEVNGKSFPFVHRYDDSQAHSESLVALRKPQVRQGRFRDALFAIPLSEQAIGRSNRDAPAARQLLTDVDVNLTAKMDETGTLAVTETIVPQKRPVKVLRFDLYKNIFLESESRDRHYNLRSVTDDQGRKLSFDHDDADELIVELAEAVPAGKPLKLKFEIDGNFLYRPDKTNTWELGIEPWFPWLDQHELAYRFHSVIKVEKPFTVFASGKELRRAEEGNYNLIETKIDNPVSWVAVLAGRYEFSQEVRKGVMIRVASFISKNETAYKKIRDVAEAAIDYYPFFLGPFPFDEITVIEKNSEGNFAYGQAPAGIVFITSEAFKPMHRDLNMWVGGVNSRFAHEIAHMYFGSAVRNTMSQDQWLDEAFAEYSAALFLKAGKNGQGDYQREFIHWKDDAKLAAEHASIPMANRLRNPGDGFGAALTRQGLIYAKGAYLLAALHKELGDQMFLTFLKSYQKSFRWKQATTKDVIDLLTFLTKKDYAPFFEQYYYGTAMPDVKLK